jgi:hypothetical protein
MSNPDRHVRPNPDGGWDVESSRRERASHHQTGAQARAWARATLRRERGNGVIRIYGRDGQTRDEGV